MICPSCGRDADELAEACQSRESPLNLPLPLKPGEKAEVLAILIQNQDSITWTAFSIAMTIEGILIAAIFQVPNGQQVINLAGLLLAVAFISLIVWSNHETNRLYKEAAQCFPRIFCRRRKLVWSLIMPVFIGWIATWIYIITWVRW